MNCNRFELDDNALVILDLISGQEIFVRGSEEFLPLITTKALEITTNLSDDAPLLSWFKQSQVACTAVVTDSLEPLEMEISLFIQSRLIIGWEQCCNPEDSIRSNENVTQSWLKRRHSSHWDLRYFFS